MRVTAYIYGLNEKENIGIVSSGAVIGGKLYSAEYGVGNDVFGMLQEGLA